MKRLVMSLATSAAALALAPAAHAVTINPGSSGLLFDPFVPASQGSVLATTSVSGQALTFAAVLRSAVYRNTAGTLDFYYQVARTGAGSFADQEIGALTVSSFSGFSVDGFVSAADPDGAGFFTAANNPPSSTTTVGRDGSNAGSVVNTDFGENGLVGSEISATYIFRTNATQFTTGTFGIINGSTFSGLAFAPAVPEPATWAMMLLGFGMIGTAIRRRPRTRVSYAI